MHQNEFPQFLPFEPGVTQVREGEGEEGGALFQQA